ncbi:MAG: protein translocase subunit SecD [Myxococcota bacterium]
MDSGWYTRLLIVVGGIFVGLYMAAPSAIYFFSDPEVRRSRAAIDNAIPDWLPDNRFNLGIDLQGGLHLVMGVDALKAVNDRADRVADEIVDAMKDEGKEIESARRVGDGPVLEIVLQHESDQSVLSKILEEYQETWEVQSRSGRTLTFAMKSDFRTRLAEDAVEQARVTLRNRIDTYGVAEPEIRKRGNDSIMIQLAGLTAEEIGKVKEDIIGRTAQLEFKLVDESSDYFERLAERPDKPDSVSLRVDSWQGAEGGIVRRPFLEATDLDELKDFLKAHRDEVPADRVVATQRIKPSAESDEVFRTWLLERKTPLTGDALTNAFVAFDSEKNQYYVAMRFDRPGAVIFERLTTNNVKRKMAIVLDDTVDSAPVIQGPIPNGNATITLGGYRSQQEVLEEANALAIVLKAGALPAPVFPQEERTVGATLGDDAVSKGQTALLFALIGVVILMLFYYRFSGVIGVGALAVNMLLLIAGLSAFSVTLTLPGIAGLALTIGMAVDANIIQFERIREELRTGKTPRVAVDAGFQKAFSAILDANITTLIAAVVLASYGSGPIRGFATTLGIGVVINTFTAVVVPRLAFDYLTKGVRVAKISI